ncbi:MAG TPA: hypothetical protein PKK26_10135 [Candidatus Wallbacteria bacterium]|nr:hypothetical protein [Candidatus Wallbacteria bacterium]
MKKIYWISILAAILLASNNLQPKNIASGAGKVVIGGDETTKEEVKPAAEAKKSEEKKPEMEKKTEEVKPGDIKKEEPKATVENKTASETENKGAITVNPPSGVAAKYSSAPSQSVELSWQEVDGAAHYLVYRTEKEEFTEDPEYKNYAFQVSGKTTVTDSGIFEDKAYYYHIVAVVRDKANPANKYYSKPSQAIKIETADVTPPEIPSGFAAEIKGEKIVLKWNKNSERDAAGYTLKKGNSKENLSVLKKISDIASCEYSDGDFEDGKQYFYAVSAFDKKGNESKSCDALSVKPENKSPIGSPEGLRLESAENQKVQIVWNEIKHPTFKNYVVLRGDSNDAAKLQPVGEIQTPLFKDDGLENGKTYYYAVIAVNKYGVQGKASDLLKATPKDSIAPAAPRNLMASPAAGTVSLSWERAKESDVKYYTVYRSENNENNYEKINGAKEVAETSFADKNVRAQAEYFYRITATDSSSNESEKSVAIKVKTPSRNFISFGKSGGLYYGFAFNAENRSIEYSESANGKSWKWWSPIQENMPLPDEFTASSKIAFAKDAKKIVAFIYDSEKTFIKMAVSIDNGKSWKWWSDYSSSLPLPDDFDENTIVNFSVRGDAVTCLCFNPAKKWLSVASTTNGKSWKWWKKAGENLGDLPNSSDTSAYSAAAIGDGYEIYSYNLKDLTLYKGLIGKESTRYSTWEEVCAKFPKPSNIEK